MDREFSHSVLLYETQYKVFVTIINTNSRNLQPIFTSTDINGVAMQCTLNNIPKSYTPKPDYDDKWMLYYVDRTTNSCSIVIKGRNKQYSDNHTTISLKSLLESQFTNTARGCLCVHTYLCSTRSYAIANSFLWGLIGNGRGFVLNTSFVTSAHFYYSLVVNILSWLASRNLLNLSNTTPTYRFSKQKEQNTIKPIKYKDASGLAPSLGC